MGEVEGKHRPAPGRWPAWLLLCPRRVALGYGQRASDFLDEYRRMSTDDLGQCWTYYPVDDEAHPPGWEYLKPWQSHGY